MSEQLAAITQVMRDFAAGKYDQLSLTRDEARSMLEERDRLAARNAKLEALVAACLRERDSDHIPAFVDAVADWMDGEAGQECSESKWLRGIARLAREAQEGKEKK